MVSRSPPSTCPSDASCGVEPSAASAPDRDLFRAEDAERFFKKNAGKPYQPSNGCEGDMFMRLWCRDCERDAAFRADPDNADGCSIIADTMCLDPSDPDYPREWQYSQRGQPVCTAFTAKDTSARPPHLRETSK